MNTDKIWPVPEILAGETYSVHESPRRSIVCTDLVGRVMHVPSGNDDSARMSRLHEMAHVAITPTDGMAQADTLGIGHDYLNVAEDMRVNYFLDNRFKLKLSLEKALLKNRAEGFELASDFRTAVLMAVAMYNTPEYELYRNYFKREWRIRITNVVARCTEFIGSLQFEDTLECAKFLQNLFKSGILDLGLEEEELAEQAIQYTSAEEIPWGSMEIITPYLAQRLPERRLFRRTQPKEYGSSILFPDRLDEDGRIFGYRRKVATATFLVDVSGSMRLSQEDITELVRTVPGALVACYSGLGNWGNWETSESRKYFSNDEGHLTIIANKGLALDMKNWKWPGGNVLDGPAIRWLGKQSKPRVWVCDGQVTGINDQSSLGQVAEVLNLQKQFGIKRVENMQAAIRYAKQPH